LAQLDCNVILHGRRAENVSQTRELLQTYAVETHTAAEELDTEAGVNAVVQGVEAGPGTVDILYNNAAIMNPWRRIWEISRAEWLETFRVNLLAMIELCNVFAPRMVERGYGRIVNLTSGIKDTPQLAPYSVSKAAVDKYTQDLAAELRGTNVLVNRLDPGWLRSDLGGPEADHPVDTVLPGALVPVLLEDFGPSGRLYAAQDFRVLG
jgi:NAD(P)-dependent dehydrogenase (short-subunit alcohol dehydrogenase family)